MICASGAAISRDIRWARVLKFAVFPGLIEATPCRVYELSESGVAIGTFIWRGIFPLGKGFFCHSSEVLSGKNLG
jgi:hypothetical protein